MKLLYGIGFIVAGILVLHVNYKYISKVKTNSRIKRDLIVLYLLGGGLILMGLNLIFKSL